MPRPPVTPVRIPRTGAFGAERNSPEDGACGVSKYPCQHPGTDLSAPKGTVVSAPANGWVLVSQAVNGPPFSGYGPAVVLLAHDDAKHEDHGGPGGGPYGTWSMRYSLLAHLDGDNLRYHLPWSQAQGITDSLKAPLRSELGTDEDIAAKTAKWAKTDDGAIHRVKPWPAWAQYVKEGEWLGTVAKDHTHWEIRTTPMGGPGNRIDPEGWLRFFDPSVDWSTATASPIRKAKGGGGGAVLLGLALAWMLSDR